MLHMHVPSEHVPWPLHWLGQSFSDTDVNASSVELELLESEASFMLAAMVLMQSCSKALT